MQGRLSAVERDNSFANLLGFATAGLLFWLLYRRGLGAEWWLDVLVPILCGAICAGFFRWATFITRPLRKLAVIAVWLGVAWIAYAILSGLGVITPLI